MPEVAMPVEDSDGPAMDLDRLTPQDLEFLEDTLRNGKAEAQRSVARVLLISERLEGAAMLFEAASNGGPDALNFCLAGLEILRLQSARDSLRELLLAIRRGGDLPEGCRVELADRFGLVSRGQIGAVLALAGDPDPEIRIWVAETASQAQVPGIDATLVSLASDPDPVVRRSAWLGMHGRDLDPRILGLTEAVAEELDPRNLEIIETLGLR
jgi:hypothetical protein